MYEIHTTNDIGVCVCVCVDLQNKTIKINSTYFLFFVCMCGHVRAFVQYYYY